MSDAVKKLIPSELISGIYPVPAVRAIIENDNGQVMILRRDNTKAGFGCWCLPGGKIEYGQAVEEALAKELLEELSVELVSSRFLFYQDSMPVTPGGDHYINFYFQCLVGGIPTLNEEHSAVSWIGFSDVNDYDIVFRNDEAIHQYFTRYK
jgi:ADP-ribose pyrophosphatase YjhB (NUDIX family)